MEEQKNIPSTQEPALPWAHVPLFAPALAVLGCAAVAVSALAIFVPADIDESDSATSTPIVAAQTLIVSPTVSPTPPTPEIAVETLVVSPAIPEQAPVETETAMAEASASAAFAHTKASGEKAISWAFQSLFADKFTPVSYEMPADRTDEIATLFINNVNVGPHEFLPAPVKPEAAVEPAATAAIQLPLPKPAGKQPITGALANAGPVDGHIGSVAALDAHFEQIDYDLANVRDLGNNVPRLYLKQLPADIADVASVTTRKRVFIKAILPVVLRVNEDILAAREKLQELRDILDSGMSLNDDQRKWLYEMADRYETDPYDWDAFMARVDIIPPSLAIAQAAEESGWGTSRFAREGNALFGQYTFAAANGMLPEERASGRQHLIRAYSSLVDGVRSYMHNLNYHRAYGEFRASRKWLRDRAKPIDGDKLAGELLRYSERGAKYVKTLRTIMRANNLAPLDDARLHNDRWTQDEQSGTERQS